jgi:hypothetical protein
MGTSIPAYCDEVLERAQKRADAIGKKYGLKIQANWHTWGKDFKNCPKIEYSPLVDRKDCNEFQTITVTSLKKVDRWLGEGNRPRCTKTEEQYNMEKAMKRSEAIKSENEELTGGVETPDGKIFVWTTGRNFYTTPEDYGKFFPGRKLKTLQDFKKAGLKVEITDESYPKSVYGGK